MEKLKDYEDRMDRMRETDAGSGPKGDPSGIECPKCEHELDWLEKSLICKRPPMRRLICMQCDFTRVVPVRD